MEAESTYFAPGGRTSDVLGTASFYLLLDSPIRLKQSLAVVLPALRCNSAAV